MARWPGTREAGESDHDEAAERSMAAAGGLRLDLDTLIANPLAVERGPGRRPVPPVGPRDIRPAADTLAVPPAERHAWVPIGPRNIAGRVRALACADPATARIWYAASAGGGVWRTANAGRAWTALWRDQPSLAVGALAVAPSRPQRIYAATGEPAGLSLLTTRGHGVYVSDDEGATWTNHAAAGAANPVHRGGFEALAVDPAEPDHCWAAGWDGLFRTLDGGTSWDRFADGATFTDVAFAGTRLYAVRGTSMVGEAAVLRLDDPGAAVAAVTLELASLSALSTVRPAVPAHQPWPVAGRIAVAPSDPDVAYVRFAAEPALRADGGRPDSFHVGVFRTTNARAATGRDMVWTRLHGHDDWIEERQGDYNLCIAVHPTDPAVVVTGMVLLHRSTNATAAAAAVRWERIMAWTLHDEGLRAHHADHHHLVVAGSPPELWVANDGGVSRSTSWATGTEVGLARPPAPGSVTWQERDCGISGAQFYDLGQSPLVPGVLAGGLQDNGTHLRTGGLTWRMVFGGDGAFTAFDPDDPYRLLISYLGGLYALQFPALLDPLFADVARDTLDGSARHLRHGIRGDPPPFVPETARHPTRTGRILHARRGRLYGTRDGSGERMVVEPVARSFELRFTTAGAALDVTVEDTPAAIALGLLPGTWRRTAHDSRHGEPATLSLLSRLAAPYRLIDGSHLRLRVDGALHDVDLSGLGAAGTQVGVADLLRVLGRALPAARINLLPYLWDTPSLVQVSTRAVGPGQQLVLDGNALDVRPDGLSRLGVNRGAQRGDDHRPAIVSLGFVGHTDAERLINRDLSTPAGQVLSVAVNGGPAREVTFAPPVFPDPARVTTGQLAAALAAALGSDPDPARAVDVVATPAVVAAELRSAEGQRVVLTGSAADRFGAPGPGSVRIPLGLPTMTSRHRRTGTRHRGCVDLRPPGPDPLELVISDGTRSTGPLRFTAADVADLGAVTAEDLLRLLTRHLAAHPLVNVRVESLLMPMPGFVTALAFALRNPQQAWAGTVDGGLYATGDDGATWTEVGDPTWRLTDRQVECIVVHPTEPVLLVGLSGEAGVAEDPGFLFRSPSGGPAWELIGHRLVAGQATGIAVDGIPLGVNGIDRDAADPQIVLAATQAGVFRSGDGGSTWSPSSEGLPNVPVVDVVTEASQRVARVAAWTRGVYERRLDDAPPADARLLVRAGELDDGRRPARQAPTLGVPAPSVADPSSPDIRIVRRRPDVGTDAELDGVVFDLDLPDDEVVAGEAADVVVQVTNIGTLPVPTASPPPAAELVRVVLLIAAVDQGPPELPTDLATLLGAGALPAGLGRWTVVEGAVSRAIAAGDTACCTLPVVWPPLDGTGTLGLLALATCPADPYTAAAATVGELLATDPHVGYREVPLRTPEQDRTLVLRGTLGGDVTVTQPPVDPAVTGVADRLGFAAAQLGAPARVLRGAAAPAAAYDLSGAGPAIVLASAPIVADVTLDSTLVEGVRTPTAVSAAEAAEILRVAARRAGVPLEAYSLAVGVTLECVGGVLVRVTGGPAAPRLGLPVTPPAGAVTRLSSAVEPTDWFDLAGAATLQLEVRAGAASFPVPVSLAAEHFSDPAAADPRTIAALVNLALAEAQLTQLVRCTVDEGLLATAAGASEVTLAGPAAIRLGLLGGPAPFLASAPGALDLTGGLALHVEVTPRVTVRFDGDPADIPDPALARPDDVRRAINAACELAAVPIRAEVPDVQLRLAGSPADTGRRPAVSGGAQLAELAASPAPIAEADRDALFTVRAALSRDTVTSGSVNHLYLRVVNAGNVAATARLRLYLLDTTASPVTTAPIGQHDHEVPPGDAHIEEFTWDPQGTPRTVTVLAIADEDLDDHRVEPPVGGFVSPADAAAFAAAHRSVLLRTLEVVGP